MKNITTILFDWAGIFCTPGELFSHPRLLKTLDMTPVEIEARVKKIQDEYYRGKISNKSFWQHVFKTFKLKGFTTKELNDAYLASYKISKRNLQVPVRLKKRYRVALLSNLTEEMMRHIVKAHDLKPRFHKLYFSNRLGYLKPEYDIFTRVMKEMKIEPQHTLFIDDSKKNLAAAKKLGIRTIHCAEPGKLLPALKRAKIL